MHKLTYHAACKLLAALAITGMGVPAMAASPEMLVMGICDPGGKIRTVSIPIEREGDDVPEDCAKACHAMCSRKKSSENT